MPETYDQPNSMVVMKTILMLIVVLILLQYMGVDNRNSSMNRLQMWKTGNNNCECLAPISRQEITRVNPDLMRQDRGFQQSEFFTAKTGPVKRQVGTPELAQRVWYGM